MTVGNMRIKSSTSNGTTCTPPSNIGALKPVKKHTANATTAAEEKVYFKIVTLERRLTNLDERTRYIEYITEESTASILPN
jgi:hypothetical protein